MVFKPSKLVFRFKVRPLLAALLSISLLPHVNAELATLKGRVIIKFVDKQHNPIRNNDGTQKWIPASPYVIRAINGNTFDYKDSAFTDADGNFVITDRAPGKWILKVKPKPELKLGLRQAPCAVDLDYGSIGTLPDVCYWEDLEKPNPLPESAPGRAWKFPGVRLVMVLYQEVDTDSADPPSQALPTPGATSPATKRPADLPIEGIVRDRSQNKLRGAEVLLAVPNSNTKRMDIVSHFKTKSGGEFTLDVPKAATPDEYLITVRKSGYAPFMKIVDEAPDLPKEIVLDLEGGGPSQEPASNTEAARRTVFSATLLQVLPTPGVRTFDSFALLAPGVFPPPITNNMAGPGLYAGIGSAGQFSMNGLRSRENNFTVDGADNNDEDVGVRRQGFVTLIPQSIESIGEFQTIGSVADSRFGRSSGGQANADTRVGGQVLHGTLYGFITNDVWNARNYFDLSSKGALASFPLARQSDGAPVLLDGRPIVSPNPSGGKNPFTRVQPGIAVDGPMPIKGMFFSFAWENQIVRAQTESNFAVPTVEQRGFLGTGATGFRAPDLSAQGAATALYPASLPGNAIFSLYPFPNNPRGPYGANTYTGILPSDGDGRLYSIKLDQTFRKKWDHRAYIRYNSTKDNETIPVTGGALFSGLHPTVSAMNLATGLTTNFSPRISNTLRANYGRTGMDFGPVNDPYLQKSSAFPGTNFLLNAPLLLNVTSPDVDNGAPRFVSAKSPAGQQQLSAQGLAGVTDTEAITGPVGQVEIGGFSPIGVDVFHMPQRRAYHTIQVADGLTWDRGRHLMSAGVDFRHVRLSSDLQQNARPLIDFSGLETGPLPSCQCPEQQSRFLSGASMAAMGAPTNVYQTLAAQPDTILGLQRDQVDLFAQDQVRLGSNFHITLGVRLHFNQLPEDENDRLKKAFDYNALLAAVKEAEGHPNFFNVGPLSYLPTAFPSDYNAIFGDNSFHADPRVGLAWRPNALHGTVIRSGFGIYTGEFPAIIANESRSTFPDYLPLAMTQFPGFTPDANQWISNSYTAAQLNAKNFLFTPATAGVLAPNSLNLYNKGGVQNTQQLAFALLNQLSILDPQVRPIQPAPHLQSPYSMQYDFTIERPLPKDFWLSVAYVGSVGRHLLRVTSPDNPDASVVSFNPNKGIQPASGMAAFPIFDGVLKQSYLVNIPFSTAPVLVPQIGISRTLFESASTSLFSSLQVEVKKNYRHGLQLNEAFTYSRSIDDASDFFDTAGAFALPQSGTNFSERGLSSFNAKYRSASYLIWDLPYRGAHAWAWLRGWQASSVITAQSGQPFTVNTSIDVNGDGLPTDRLNTTIWNGQQAILKRSASDPSPVQYKIAPNVNTANLLAGPGLAQNTLTNPFGSVVLNQGAPFYERNGAVGRNTFQASALSSIDIALSRTFEFRGQSILFRAEVFNALNRTNFGIPDRILESPAFGSAVNTITPARTIQFALKFVGVTEKVHNWISQKTRSQ